MSVFSRLLFFKRKAKILEDINTKPTIDEAGLRPMFNHMEKMTKEINNFLNEMHMKGIDISSTNEGETITRPICAECEDVVHEFKYLENEYMNCILCLDCCKEGRDGK